MKSELSQSENRGFVPRQRHARRLKFRLVLIVNLTPTLILILILILRSPLLSRFRRSPFLRSTLDASRFTLHASRQPHAHLRNRLTDGCDQRADIGFKNPAD